MKRLLLLLPLAIALVACDSASLPTESGLTVAPSYSVGNGPARYQTSSTTWTLNVLFGTYIHTYTLTTNPCNGTQTMTGYEVSNDGRQPSTSETVTYTLVGNVLTYHAVYDDPFYLQGNGFHFSYDAEIDGTTYIGAGASSVVVTKSTTTSSYKNHGDYVSHSANKNDAAHSCIGMPIVP